MKTLYEINNGVLVQCMVNINRGLVQDCRDLRGITLDSITLPDCVRSIGNRAFEGCHSLTGITIPNSVTRIGDRAFFGCDSLTSITLPNSVTCISDEAFFGCHSLTSITLPDSVTDIGHGAFWDCSSLTEVVVGHNSYAEQYAKEHDLPYTYPDAND